MKKLVIPLSVKVLSAILIAILCLCYPVQSQAQLPGIYDAFSEKIYLQLDSKVYTTDKTIWFKAVVTNSETNAPTTLSNVLYAELIDPSERILEKKIIKIDKGIGNGFFDLKPAYQEGLYLVRAYTKWNMNFGTDFFFNEYVRVFPGETQEKANPFGKITLVEKENKGMVIKTEFKADVAEWFHDKKIPVFLYLDNQKDSIVIKKSKDDKYSMEYTLPEKSNYVTLQIKNKNQVSFTKTLAINKEKIDLQFFPESGELVHDLKSIVGFKALDNTGKGLPVEGEVLNKKGDTIALFKSNLLGMGSFEICHPDSAMEYFAKLKTLTNENAGKVYYLPKVVAKGNLVSVSSNVSSILVTTSSSYLKNDSIFIRATTRGITYFDVKQRLNNGKIIFNFNPDFLPQGIIVFSMLDRDKQPLAERLYFNQKPEND